MKFWVVLLYTLCTKNIQHENDGDGDYDCNDVDDDDNDTPEYGYKDDCFEV